MKEETFDEIVGRALRGEPYVPTGGGDDAPAQPAAHVQKPAEIEHVAGDLSKNGMESNMGVAYAPMPAPESYGTRNGRMDPEQPLFAGDDMFDFADRTHALRASHGQAPAGAASGLRTDALQTLAYCNGLKAGWNFCVAEDEEGYARAMDATSEALQALKQARHATPTAQAAPAADYDHGPQSLTVAEAARHVGKWLNERPNRPLDLRDVAMLVAHAQAPAAGAVAGPDVRYALAHADTAADLLMRAHEQAPETWCGWYDDALVHIDIARKALAAAPTPAAQADSQPSSFGSPELQAMILARCVEKDKADSVLEDAALLNFIEQHPEMSLRHRKGKWAFVGFTNYEYEMLPSLREAIRAARKQGVKP